MAKKYKGYDDIKDIEIKTEEDVVEMPTQYRTLFVGLGGTGGEVLCKLTDMMSDEEKEQAHIIYMDMDTRDVKRLKARGMNAVSLSSSDTVSSVMRYLGEHDGVKDWLPHGDNDTTFLSSKTDDGASQFRMKSRLCMAKYLSDNASEFNSLLDEICAPGALLANETLRVMIVSSVAGGTGAGTFIQVALYLREYFRSNGHNDITIMGLFACPDLFVRASNSDGRTISSKKENMYSNAYAAVRELNAMNLAVNLSAAARKKEGYGKNINISINTRSEGKLFDSNDPELSKNDNNKPFNLLYFVDVNNTEGGILRSLDQYYDVMADIVYTRLYSPIEGPLRSDENNELSIHSRFPTAIYGSAGYGRIIYPYHGILNYLAVRKTYEELDYTWSILDNEWTKYKRNQQIVAKGSGSVWVETTEERGKQYISNMNTHIGKTNSRLRAFKGMIREGDSEKDRAERFLDRLEASLKSGNGIDTDSASKDAVFGLHKDEAIAEERKKLAAIYAKLNSAQQKRTTAETALKTLRAQALSAKVATENYISVLQNNLVGKALLIASQVAPRNAEDGLLADEEKSSLNLYHGLLCINGVAVHPVAARYLLYRLREKMLSRMRSDEDLETKPKSMEALCADLELALDKPNDGKKTTVEMRVTELSESFSLFKGASAKKAVSRYQQKLKSVADQMMTNATNALRDEVFKQVLTVVDRLIAQYEGLFDNLKPYKEEIALQLKQEEVRHESSSDNRCVFINASRKSKEYLFSGDLRTRDVLEKGNGAIDSAAGKGIYDALIARTWAQLEKEETALITQYQDEKEDTYSDLGGVFTSVMRIYRDYLEKNATHLNCSVVSAIVSEICQKLNITKADMTKHAKRMQVQNEFSELMKDMIEKAKPMLNFDFENKDTYYEEESEDEKISTTVYMHLGLSPEQAADLVSIYGGVNVKDALEAFEKEFRPSRGATVSEEMSPYEMICFQAVHCLQPTQIRKFHEDNVSGYYPYYMDRLRSMVSARQYSESPHLDKRWHLREAMPYISRSMEQKWVTMTAKAFVNELLNDKFRFTTDSDGITCFTYKKGGKDGEVHVYWPEEKLITINDISRLLEYLQEHDARVTTLCEELDTTIENVTDFVSKYTDNMPNYKWALTTNPILTKLRSNMMTRKTSVSTLTMGHGKNGNMTVKEAKPEDMALAAKLLGAELLDSVDTVNSKGGILNIAWLVHKSEERQGRDYDYGEAIIRCVLEIVDKLCQNMFSEDITKDSDNYGAYRDLYNSVLEKFMESFVAGILAQLKQLAPEQLENVQYVRYHRYLNIPKIVTDTQEFAWVNEVWKLKK